MRTVVVVKTGYPLVFRLQAYRTFFRAGWRVAVADRPLHQGACVADVAVVTDLDDPAGLARAVRARAGDVDALLTFNDSGLVAAAEVATRLGLPALSTEVTRTVTDKTAQRRVLAAADVPVPAWRPVSTPDEIIGALDESGRVVVKPADRAASAGVTLVDDPVNAPSAFALARDESGTGRVLVEEYVDGPEYSVESIAVAGRQRPLCITEKRLGEPPFFLELGHALPATLDNSEAAAVRRVAEEACAALGLDRGACHTEVRLTDRGPVLIEVNARAAGDRIIDLVRLATGIDVYGLLLREAAGETLESADIEPSRHAGAAIRFQPSPGGVLRGVRVDSAEDLTTLEHGVIGEPGMVLPPATTNGGRVAYALAQGPDATTAAQTAERTLASLHVDVTEAPAAAREAVRSRQA